MLYQIERFVAYSLLVLLLAFLGTIYPEIRRLTDQTAHFDKYQHFFGGLLLMAGFFDAWKKNTKTAFLWVLAFNLAWELFELKYFYNWVFDAGWRLDTVGDMFVTSFAAMLTYFIFFHKSTLK